MCADWVGVRRSVVDAKKSTTFCTASSGYGEPQERARLEVEGPRNRKKTALEPRESQDLTCSHVSDSHLQRSQLRFAPQVPATANRKNEREKRSRDREIAKKQL